MAGWVRPHTWAAVGTSLQTNPASAGKPRRWSPAHLREEPEPVPCHRDHVAVCLSPKHLPLPPWEQLVQPPGVHDGARDRVRAQRGRLLHHAHRYRPLDLRNKGRRWQGLCSWVPRARHKESAAAQGESTCTTPCTCAASCLSRMAAANPAGPAPTMQTSNSRTWSPPSTTRSSSSCPSKRWDRTPNGAPLTCLYPSPGLSWWLQKAQRGPGITISSCGAMCVRGLGMASSTHLTEGRGSREPTIQIHAVRAGPQHPTSRGGTSPASASGAERSGPTRASACCS